MGPTPPSNRLIRGAAPALPRNAPKVARPMSESTGSIIGVSVDMTHDIVCPWCRIGHHNLRTALKDWTGPGVTVRFTPYLLNPDAPAEGVDLRAHLGARYGAANVEAMFTRVTAIGAQAGIKFDFAKIRRVADTSRAHTLLAHAPASHQEKLLDAIYTAHFENGSDPGDRAMLFAAWRSVGLEEAIATASLDDTTAIAATRKQALVAAQTGIGGVPHFVISGPKGQTALHGAQPVEAFRAALRQVV
jgi:predicted DsbA family dithiol-disulfide isomerase